MPRKVGDGDGKKNLAYEYCWLHDFQNIAFELGYLGVPSDDSVEEVGDSLVWVCRLDERLPVKFTVRYFTTTLESGERKLDLEHGPIDDLDSLLRVVPECLPGEEEEHPRPRALRLVKAFLEGEDDST